MNSKLAVFDFDHTIKYPNKGWKMGVSHFFPGGEIPEDLHQIREEQGKIFTSSDLQSCGIINCVREEGWVGSKTLCRKTLTFHYLGG